MKRRVATIFVLLMAFASVVFAGGNGLSIFAADPATESPFDPQAQSKSSNKKSKGYVYMKSDEGWQMDHNGRKIMVVVGNFSAYHNGTVITADSAVRYSERHIECFGRVLINRGSTYIYGERAEYNGNTSIAKVYDKIIKVVDGDATLYTYNFTYNTKRQVGYYKGGGVMICNDNIIESDRGYLYSERDELVCVDKVQMRNNEYEMMADSVVYNIETDFAQFFTRTNIWNKGKDGKEDDYLYADRGSFDKAKQLYKLTKNGYILTKDQELLCDSLDYFRDSNYVLLRRNIQIDDRSQKMLIFGDWGQYWKEPGNVFVTKNPLLISYDTEQSDSVFIRSDSMYLFTRYPIREQVEKARKDSLEAAKAKAAKAAEEAKVAKSAEKTPAKAEKADKADKATAKAEKRGRNAKGKAADSVANGRRDELKRRQEQHAAKAKGEALDEPTAPLEPNETNVTKRNSVTGVTGVTGDTVAVTAVTVPQNDNAKEPQKSAKEARAELRRAMIDSLASDTTAQGKKLRKKLIKREASEVAKDTKRAIKEQIRQKKAAYKAMLAERNAFLKKLLVPAKERDAKRKEAEKRAKDSLARVAKMGADTLQKDSVKVDTLKRDSVKIDSVKLDSVKVDSVKVDSVKVDSLAPVDTLAKFDTMTVKQLKAYFKAKRDKEKAEQKRIKEDSLEAKLERIGLARQAKRAEQYRKWEIHDSIYLAKAKLREEAALRRKFARWEKRGKYVEMADSATLAKVDSIIKTIYGPLDKETNYILDSLLHILYPDIVPEPVREEKRDTLNMDSLYREILALGRVKLFRSDIQSICDSLATSSVDSIINMYKSPVLWSGSNQISSEKMHIYTSNSQLVKAIFDGKPIMIAEIDTTHYNQVAGKEMISLFRDNKVYRNDVNGNVQTIYFMQEDNSPEITLMAYIEAGDMTSYIEDQTLVGITYRGNPTYTFYPMDKIPETQPLKLPEFKWEKDKRPTLASIFTRTIRPSTRAKVRAIRKPSFPINALLEQRKKDYIRRREWRDRKDVVSTETKEWIKTLK